MEEKLAIDKFEAQKKAQLSKPVIRHDKSLKEIEEERRIKREESVRKRAKELQEESAAPKFSVVNRTKTPEPRPKSFKAEDPEVVS